MTFPVSRHMAADPAALVSVSERVCVCHAALSACMIHEASSFPLISRESITVSNRHTDVYLTQRDWHRYVQTIVQVSTPTEQRMFQDYLNFTWLLILCFYLFQWNRSLMFTGFPEKPECSIYFLWIKKKCNLYCGKCSISVMTSVQEVVILGSFHKLYNCHRSSQHAPLTAITSLLSVHK